ncbi:YggT family protein [uncultured Sphingomonas sp.]|uniref:YggT family protein n=1 Tax=uncultured Sphingomonas sp. TaxID=158754 RepID=UPI0035C9CB28
MIYLLQIVQFVLTVVWWIIIVQAILSWLIAFNVINTSNNAVRQIWMALEKMTDPIYRPIRRVLPDFGALDLSPLVVLLLVGLLDRLVTTAIIGQVSVGAI